MSDDILEGLNEEQRRAVQITEGPLLIIAGPGSGKTRVITHRIAYLVNDMGVRPWKILAVTFTNKAANEMKQRLFGTSSEDPSAPLFQWRDRARDLAVSTFHAFCARALRRFGHHIGLDRGFSIFDATDQLSLVKAALEEEGLDPKHYPPRAILGVISRAKSNLMDAQALSLRADSVFEEAAGRVYVRYQELLDLNEAVDFDDLLMRTVELLGRVPSVLEYYQERFRYLLVDEFQDTNVAQYELSKLISDVHKNICVVGDPDQSIYSWRSADVRNILDFKKDYPDAKVVNLEINYRSTGTIIQAAKSVIASNMHRPEKDIRASRHQGKPLVVYETYDVEEEAYFVVTQISNLLRRKDATLSDCAVMYRTNAQSRALEEACLHRAMPYHVVGGIKFYHRAEVRDIIAYLRLINNPADDVSLMRIINKPRRAIGRKSLDMLQDLGREKQSPIYPILRPLAERKKGEAVPYGLPSRLVKPLTDFVNLMEELREATSEMGTVKLLEKLLRGINYQEFLRAGGEDWEDKWENVKELRRAAGQYDALEPGEGLTAFLEHLALVAEVDFLDETADAITLITLHQAKGLEFPVVFIIGLQEGLLPHIRSLDDPSQLEEERRLFYVGITRCMDRLFLIRSFRQRGWRGEGGLAIPSRFLRDLPSELIAEVPQIVGSRYGGQSFPDFSSGEANVVPRRRVSSVVGAGNGVVNGTGDAGQEDGPSFREGDRVLHGAFGEGLVLKTAGQASDSEVTVVFREAGVKRLLLSFANLKKVEG